jgi:hypothetical protein
MTRYPADQRVLRMSCHAVRSTLASNSGSDLTRACRRPRRLAHPCRVQPRTPRNTGVDINKSIIIARLLPASRGHVPRDTCARSGTSLSSSAGARTVDRCGDARKRGRFRSGNRRARSLSISATGSRRAERRRGARYGASRTACLPRGRRHLRRVIGTVSTTARPGRRVAVSVAPMQGHRPPRHHRPLGTTRHPPRPGV